MAHTDFHIDVMPVSISLECPHCDTDIVLNFEDIYVSVCWGDDWGTVKCPVCAKILNWVTMNMINILGDGD